MKVIFLGVGEAFDENYPNNSQLILSEKTNLLLDCGYLIPAQLWKYSPDKDFLDAIYISHCHADHYFGLPALLVRMWEEKRKKPLTIISQKGNKKTILEMLELAYQGFSTSDKLGFDLNFIEVEKFKETKFNELFLDFAPTTHSLSNLAIKVSDGKNSVCYSGDGMFNQETEKLYENSGLVIQETYLLDEEKIGHATVMQLIEMAKRRNIKNIALTHLNRNFRKQEINKIRDLILKESAESLKILLPEPLDEYDL